MHCPMKWTPPLHEIQGWIWRCFLSEEERTVTHVTPWMGNLSLTLTWFLISGCLSGWSEKNTTTLFSAMDFVRNGWMTVEKHGKTTRCSLLNTRIHDLLQGDSIWILHFDSKINMVGRVFNSDVSSCHLGAYDPTRITFEGESCNKPWVHL